ncbi:MAG: tetratricopeptide repeat protein [Bacteroidales bacterium]|nr:tetratricopeptide repeat protein [Bacteroidales bacterium]
MGQLVTKTPSGEVQKEIDAYLDEIRQLKDTDDAVGLSSLYNKVAYLYWENGSTREAVSFFSKSININESIGNLNGIQSIQTNIGGIYLETGDYANAQMYFKKSLKINKQRAVKADIAFNLYNIAEAQQAAGENNASVATVTEALGLAKEINSISLLKNCYLLLAENHETLGDAKKQTEFFNLYAALQSHLQEQKWRHWKKKAKMPKLQSCKRK